MKLTIDAKTRERVFELRCPCGTQGGEIRFPIFHGRESDEALEKELKAQYSHICDDCCCKEKICDKHAENDEAGHIVEPRVSVHPNKAIRDRLNKKQ